MPGYWGAKVQTFLMKIQFICADLLSVEKSATFAAVKNRAVP